MSFTVLGAMRGLDESRHHAELYRGWNAGLSAGLGSSAALDQMGRIACTPVEEARRYLVVGTAQGKQVAALVMARPALFTPFEGAMLAAGSDEDTLGRSLGLLAECFAADFRRGLRVRTVLGYLIFIGLVASFGLPFALMPKGPIRGYVMAIAVVLAAFLLLGGVGLSLVATALLNAAAPSRARFARLLASALEAGIPAGRAVRLAVDASGNARLAEHLKKRTERELRTTPLATLFEGCDAVPAALMSQLRLADATRDFRGTLGAYAREVDSERT